VVAALTGAVEAGKESDVATLEEERPGTWTEMIEIAGWLRDAWAMS
jgi:hypothetical protein